MVIDVFRAFSTACYLSSAGVQSIWAVSDAQTALEMRRHDPGILLMGERGGFRIPGFDLGNSPCQVMAAGQLPGRSVVMTTSNGTRGLAGAGRAGTVITGGFVNAGAIVAYIKRQAPQVVTMVCMGSGGRPAIEDTLCGIYLRSRLLGEGVAFDRIRETILNHGRLTHFYDPSCTDMPLEDLNLCLAEDLFNFVLIARNGSGGKIHLEREDM